MAKKKIGYEINRNEYNRVRKMDHQQMQQWANDIYEKGKQASKSLTPEEMRERLMDIKGVGEAKAEVIIEVLKQV